MFDVDHDKERAQAAGLEPNGFNFEGADPSGVDYALNRSVNIYNLMSEFSSSVEVFCRSYLFFILAVRLFQGKVNKTEKLYHSTTLLFTLFSFIIWLDRS